MVLSIAMLGTGLMGAPMAARLLAAGHAVRAWNRTRDKLDPLRAKGAGVAATPAEAVAGADAVITMLENGAVVDTVLFASGAADALRPGALVIDMSSIAPADARDHARRLETLGAAHLDAPVSGGTKGAAEGTLAIMVGGRAADFARAGPVFAALGRATHVGPHGAGQVAKLANQVIVGVTIGAVAEALLLAVANGADPEAVRRALAGGFADSPILRQHGRRMTSRDFTPGGRAAIHLKDMNNILDAAAGSGLSLPLAEVTRALFAALVAGGDGDLDHAALALALERRNAPARIAPTRIATKPDPPPKD